MLQLPTKFIILGILGALAYVILWSKGFQELLSYTSVRHVVVGAIVGYVYTVLYSDYNFPNQIMCFVAGYMGPDFIEGLLERFKPKPKEGP